MFICSVKLSKKRLIAAFAVFGGLVGLLFCLRAVMSADRINFAGCEEYLAANGLSGNLILEDEIRIPEEFSEIYEEYNKMQKTAGFDLSDYSGKICKRYTYSLNDTQEEIHVVFLLYNEKLIGGDIHEQRYEGWVKPL